MASQFRRFIVGSRRQATGHYLIHPDSDSADDRLVYCQCIASRGIRSPWVIAGISIGWMAALVLMHYPMLFSGMHQMQADLGDSRLNNYFLEHSYRWITGDPQNSSFWSPRFFYPQSNATAYSDLMLSFAPCYWCWRAIGFLPDTAFQLWMMVGTTLNFLVALAWLRNCCKCSWFGAVIGAIFFSVAGPRATQLGHQQLQWQVFPMLGLISIYKIFKLRRTYRWWTLLGLCIAAQFWGAFYMEWFFVFAVGIAGMLAIIQRRWRKRLAVVLHRDAKIIFAVGIAVALLVAPAVLHYLSAMNEVGGHPFEEVQLRLATPSSWIFPGPYSVERAVAGRWIHLPPQPFERAVGLGVITSCMAIAGLWFGRRTAGVRLLACTGILIVCLSTLFFDRVALWRIAFNSVPGAEVIRAPGRFGLLLIIPASLGLAYFVDYFQTRQRLMIALGLFVCLFEQAIFLPSYDKQQARNRVSAITAVLPADTKCFFYVGDRHADRDWTQLDAMWASMQTGIPTINGYSGSTPAGWDMLDDVLPAADHAGRERELRIAVNHWAGKWAVDPAKVSWLQQAGPDRVCRIPEAGSTAGLDTRTVP